LNYPHNIIVRRNRGRNRGGNSGLSQGYSVSLECTVDADTPVTDAHQLSTLLERELSASLDNIVDVFVHLEPPEAA
jgi:divalent metal cation (Fe/Co/Zn/Cd) transporter